VISVLRHFHRYAKYRAVKRALGTDQDGTDISSIVNYLRRRSFVVRRRIMRMLDLESSLASGGVVIACVDGDHLVVAYGIDTSHVHIADPSVLRCAGRRIARRRFRQRWDRDGLVIRPR
jgi:ABC-type bacteriocin/lantibiotic exporter with double-glycine peptidase domain